MKLTTTQKGYLTLLGLGVVTLGIDRTYFSPEVAPRSAARAPTTRGDAVVPAGVPVMATETNRPAPSVPPAGPQVEGPRFAERLRAWGGRSDLSSLRDAFALSPRWGPGARPAAPHGAEAAAEAAAEEFRGKHKLLAVILSGSRSQAMIDHELVRVGQTIDGFTLLSVAQGVAHLASKTAQVDLTITGLGTAE